MLLLKRIHAGQLLFTAFAVGKVMAIVTQRTQSCDMTSSA